MIEDFFEVTKDKLRDLNQNERELFDYVVKNINLVKTLSIQKFAATQFISTTSIFRFTKKLGFTGYSDFIASLVATSTAQQSTPLPDIVKDSDYSQMYLKNIMEAARVMSAQYVDDICEKLKTRPNIYILCDDSTHGIGQYAERLFIGLGFRAYFPEAAYQMQTLVSHVQTHDMIIALSYTGEDETLCDFIKRVYLKEKPYLMSITRADNNVLESLSDANFYMFAEAMHLNGMDLTSTLPMLMILELLVYAYMKKEGL